MSVYPGMTAGEIITGVHDGAFTVQDVADAHMSRIDEVDVEIRAFATVDADLVRTEAAWLDAQRQAGARLPLHGVPVGVKDIIDVAGLSTIAGFEPYRDEIALRDAEIVSRLRSLGALMLGKTHTTQFAVGDPAPTRNPWNVEKSPAGSSAGSGAAIPARMVPVALGSQTAGSMLRPASFNGSVGFKPTFGWMSMDGVIPLCWSLDHLGLYAATVNDVAAVYSALTSAEASEHRIPGPPRFALLPEYLEMSDASVSEHVQNVAAQLRSVGAIVDEINLPMSFESIYAVHQVIFSAEMSAVHSANLTRYPEHYGQRIRSGVEAGSLIPANYLLQARRLQRTLSRQIDEWLSGYDAVLMPTVSTEACDIAETGDRRFQVPATLLGLPAISLPTGLGPGGLPLGTQVIGRAGADTQLLTAAEWIADHVPLIGRPEIG